MSEEKYLRNARRLQPPISIKSAKANSVLYATKTGDVHSRSYVNGSSVAICIRNVLFVPGLECNLMSVSALERAGYSVLFQRGRGVISKRGKQLAVATRDVKMYKLHLSWEESYAHVCEVEIGAELWHRRLGHIGRTSLQNLQKLVDGIGPFDQQGKHTRLCSTCVQGKQTKLPHNETRQRATRPLQLVHSDLLGPVTPTTYDGKRYVLTFIDDFTHYTVAYLLSTKSETFKCFKLYEAMATAHFGTRISRFRCDNGREYLSTAMRQHFDERGIQYEFTIRHTPQQNGVAERMNRTIMEKARCMLLESNLRKSLWGEAVLAAVYLTNRSPTSALVGAVPAELWHGERPNLKKLRVFGCVAYLKIPGALVGSKLNSKTMKCHLLGYCANGYRLLSTEDNKIYSGRDVIFDETPRAPPTPTPDFYQRGDIFEDAGEGGEGDATQQEEEEGEEPVSADEDGEPPEKKSRTEKPGLTRRSEKEPDIDEPKLPRRSERTRKRPKHLDDYAEFAFSAETFVEDVPETYEDIEGRDDAAEWYEAVKTELDSLRESGTWTLTDLPPGKRAIESRWVFKKKQAECGKISQYKARLVEKGCAQRKGFDYDEVYAPVARLTTLRTLLAVVNNKGLYTRQLDVKNAFLHGDLEEEIYMKIPTGVSESSYLVCRLLKTLYGLKQAPRAWNLKFDKFVKHVGFVQSKYDACLYYLVRGDSKVYMLIYVDDVLMASDDNKLLQEMTEKLGEEFRMKDLGPLSFFLGIKVEMRETGMKLSQPVYVTNMLERFGMENSHGVSTPMEPRPSCDTTSEAIIETKPYRELVGCLMYLTRTTRPDLSAAVNFYSRFQSNATEAQWVGLKRILRYVQATRNLGLYFPNNNNEPLVGYADADWANDEDRKSITGTLFEVLGCTVSWMTRKQQTVALSSTEAEYVALAIAGTEFQWLKGLLSEMGFNLANPVTIYEDNQACIHLLRRWEHSRLKHVDVKYKFIQDLHNNRAIAVTYIPTANQKADLFTKGLTRVMFERLRSSIGVAE